jgi:hypothetical protein
VSDRKIPFPSEFLPKGTEQEKTAQGLLGTLSNMLSHSKSVYLYDNPTHVVVFNANLCTKEDGKIWYGDIDLTLQHKSLRKLAEVLGKTVYVLPEHSARFDKERQPAYSEYIAIVDKFGELSLSNLEFFYLKKGVPHLKTSDELSVTLSSREKLELREEDYEPIELPALSSIRVLKTMDPINLFWKKIIEDYGKDTAQEIFDRLYVTESYYQKLTVKLKKFLEKTYPNLHPAKIEQDMGWHLLNLGPNHFIDKQAWEKSNTGYLKK